MTVTDALPVYHHRERHSLRVAASPEAALAAARETPLEEVRVVSILFRLRGLRAAPRGPIWTSMQAQGFRFMENHIFYPALRGGRLDFWPFASKLAGLSDDEIGGLIKAVPEAWCRGDDLPAKIVAYLCEARDEVAAFMNFVKHILR